MQALEQAWQGKRLGIMVCASFKHHSLARLMKKKNVYSENNYYKAGYKYFYDTSNIQAITRPRKLYNFNQDLNIILLNARINQLGKLKIVRGLIQLADSSVE